MDPNSEVYLGDGLYAGFSGYDLVLRAPRAEGDHWVALEPEVAAELVSFIANIEAIFGSVPLVLAFREAVRKHWPHP